MRPPAGAPNVLIVLIDDAGFGSNSAFGGPANTPTFERLAADGLKYTRFHTTALCSPTRAALLSGRNHHTVGMGGITEIATSAPGYSSVRPNTCAPLAETLKLNGYSTAQFGKCHEVPVWQTSPMGPFDAWPSVGGGFEHFYGFIGGETNQYAPALYNGTTPVEPDRTPEEGYHLTEDLADHAIDWVRQQKALMPDKPFFIYFAPGATHAPAPRARRVVGQVQGQVRPGLGRAARGDARAPEGAWRRAPGRGADRHGPPEIPAWDDMPDALKPVLARQMEVYAGFMEHTDHHVGRLIDAIADLGVLDDTLVYPHHRRQRGVRRGHDQRHLQRAADRSTARPRWRPPEFMAARVDKFGTPDGLQPLRRRLGARDGHALPVDQAGRQPLGRHPQRHDRPLAQRHQGQGRDAQPVPPRHRRRADGARGGRAARADLRPRRPAGAARGRRACSYTFDDAEAAERHETQYFEMFVNRGIYHKGWTAVTRHSTPWVVAPLPPLDDDVWELYAPDDWTQAHDLAAEQPERLHELQRLFLIEAAKYNVLPLDDRRVERFNSDLAGRPQLVTGNSPDRCSAAWGGCRRTRSSCIKNKSHAVTASVVVPEGGGRRRDHRPGRRVRRLEPLRPRRAAGLLLQPVRPPAVQGLRRRRRSRPASTRCAWSSPTTAAGSARAAPPRLFVDGAQGRRGPRRRRPCRWSSPADETTDVGSDTGTPVSDDYAAGDGALHRADPLGPDRHRRGGRGPRPPHHARGAAARRDGAPVATHYSVTLSA